jgi:hypothetical protein
MSPELWLLRWVGFLGCANDALQVVPTRPPGILCIFNKAIHYKLER